MKLSFFLLSACVIQSVFPCRAQNAVSGAVGLYGVSYNAATTVLSGGSIFVGAGGNWFLGGNITGANKGNPNSPNATGRSEVITFDGTGKTSGGATTPGAAGTYINGYAATTGTATTTLVLPVGGSSAVYPFTVPAGAAVQVAFFDGSGSTSSVPVLGIPTTEFSQYFDMPSGWPAGVISMGYPSGLLPGFNSILTSTTGTSFSLATNIPDLQLTANTVASATVSASTASRLYLSSSPVLLPVELDYFHGSRETGYNLLQWGVSDPWDIDYFQVYKHGTQTTLFSTVYTTPASDSLTTYSFEDPADTGSAYYQLALVGKNGSVTRSPIVYIPGEENASAAISVFPNPASTSITLSLSSRTPADLYCSIFDMSGEKIAAKLVPVDGKATIQWDVSGFARGIYTLNIRNSQTGTSQNLQFVKH